ncbi:MAG: anthranilate phosphoribosyltransferase [Candidatus Zixiibacteriota bacterium]
MIKLAINKLIQRKDLSAEESKKVMGQIMSQEASPAQVAAYLTALRLKGETPEEILGSAQAMRENVVRIEHHQEKLFDHCGTGGDGAGTFNISTTSAFILAACGLAVGKHGNRCVSSQCGSADLLQALGADIFLSPDQVGTCIDQAGIGFLFAPLLHPAMKHVAPIRKELGFRTVFNILGPLTNPAFATHQLIGVFDADYTEKLALVAQRLGLRKTFVVFNLKNIDELTTLGPNKVSTVSDGTPTSFFLNPEDFGFQKSKIEELKGGTAEENARITLSILKGEKGAKRDTVVFNAALALLVGEIVKSVKEGIDLAAECIDSGRALNKLETFINFTNSFKNVR